MWYCLFPVLQDWGQGENNGILVLGCIGCVEPNRVVMMTFKIMMTLGFGIGITS